MTPLFHTITDRDWRKAIARGRSEPNVAYRQIREHAASDKPMREALLARGKRHGEPWCRGGSLLLTKP